MPILKHGRIALVIGVLLMPCGMLARAGDKDCDNCDCDNCQCEPGRWEKIKCWCKGEDSNGCKKCKKCHGCSKCCGVVPLGYHCDPRDTRLYSAQGYDVPVAVPLAPNVKHTYNYGWGIPSSRLVRVGAQYNQWYPNEPFTQTGGRLPGGIYPTVYQATDTTQLGAYYMHTPRWGRYNGIYGTW